MALIVLFYLSVYRIYSSIVFHGSLLHVLFNMLAFVPLGSELERIMGSIRMLYIIILLATSNAIFHLLIALVVGHNPLHSLEHLMDECAIGFSGVIFSLIVIETRLSGAQSRRLVFPSSSSYSVYSEEKNVILHVCSESYLTCICLNPSILLSCRHCNVYN